MRTMESIRADLPELKTQLPGPNAKALIQRDSEVISPSYTRTYPLVVARGSGAMIEDVDGNRFLDFNAGIAVCSTGHCHPQVVQAIQDQATRLIHMSGTDFYYENMVALAETLNRLAGGDRRIYFGNSGTEAIEAALKLARFHTKRGQFVAFFGSFHGRTMGSLALTGSKSVQKAGFFPMMPGVHHVPYPNCYRCPYGQTPDHCAVECVSTIEDQLFRHTVPAQEVAAIFVEPVQGEGGYVVPPRKFFDELRKLADKHGILIVADEIQSGMGRTGKMFASEHFDFVPCMMTLAKGIASGMPLSAAVARADLMDWTPGAHASTFGGNPVCVAAAIATIELIERELMQNAELVGRYLMSRLRELPSRSPIVGDVRGLGLMIGIEIVRDQETKERAPDLRDRIIAGCFERGLLILGAGPNSIRLSPPLIITKDQADFAAETIESVIASVAA
jgi:4-aminobutyrate aminotransferase